jgi:hypothetical protein
MTAKENAQEPSYEPYHPDGEMQFLCIFKTREITDTTSRRAQRALLLSAKKLLEYREEGKVIGASLMSHRTPLYTYAVFQVSGPEELDKLLWGIPGLPFLHTEIHVTFPVETVIDFLEKRIAAKLDIDTD